MAPASLATRDGFLADLGSALHTSETALVPKTRRSRSNQFQYWIEFCKEHGRPPCLSDVPLQETRLCYLLVYAVRYRRRTNPQTGELVRADTVEAVLIAVGKGIAALGQPDPRKQAGGERNHPLLASFLQAMRDQDSPSTRAYPANISIIEHLHDILDTTHPTAGQANKHAIDLCIIGFFWLLRPAEYLHSSGEGRSQAFRLCDVSFTIAGHLFVASDSSLNDLNIDSVSKATLTFNDQKNAVRGEQISHTATNDPRLCPCKALARICLHLRLHHAPAKTPLYVYYQAGKQHYATPSLITNALRHSATDLAATTGIAPHLLSARSVRPGGATALLCANIDPNIIQLLGRWKSDAMLRYLRVAAQANSHPLAQQMLQAGRYTFAPQAFAAATDAPIPQQAPAAFITANERAELLA